MDPVRIRIQSVGSDQLSRLPLTNAVRRHPQICRLGSFSQVSSSQLLKNDNVHTHLSVGMIGSPPKPLSKLSRASDGVLPRDANPAKFTTRGQRHRYLSARAAATGNVLYTTGAGMKARLAPSTITVRMASRRKRRNKRQRRSFWKPRRSAPGVNGILRKTTDVIT